MARYKWMVTRVNIQNGASATENLNMLEEDGWEIFSTSVVAGTGEWEGKNSMYITARFDQEAEQRFP